jgi:hypothetical protein
MRTVLAVSLLALACGCSRPRAADAVSPEEAKRLLIDRNWLDRYPGTPSDRLNVFRFVPKMGGGVFQDRTLYAGQFELFSFEATGEEIRFQLWHTGDTARTRYTVERLPKDKKSPFDLKLTLESSPRGPSVYYGWTQDHADDLDGSLAKLPAR